MTANWRNRTLFHGDNLAFLRAMNSESVDLIATDPPFNKGRDFHATPDSLAAGAKFQDRWSWERDVHDDWVDQIRDDWPKLMEAIESARFAHSDGMGAYMCFMAVRLLEMRHVLRSNGTIYLHCDPTASHYLKAVMDAIFGHRNFRNEIVWCYRGGGVPRKDFAKKHDLILRYAKGKAVTFNVDDVRIPYSEDSTERLEYTARSFRRNKTYDNYRPNPKGKHPEDWWVMQPIMPSSKERVGYPTQKPYPLYERMLLASSNEGDVVLDPFAGCATTLIVAESLRRRWVGIDIWPGAYRLVVERMEAQSWLSAGKVTLTDKPPGRTDDSLPAAPFMRTVKKVQRVAEPPDKFKTREAKLAYLLSVYGCVCAGCGREFDDPRYLDLDHNAPRSTGGLNHTSNRILLCGPCNRLKSDIYTLKGLRKENAKRGYMAGSGENPKLKEIRESRERNPGLFDR